MDIVASYNHLHKINDFAEYHTPRFYETTNKSAPKLAAFHTKRQTFIKDIEKLSQQSPGPGRYSTNPEDNKKSNKYQAKVDFAAVQKQHLGRQTYIDMEIKRTASVPAIGKYKIEAGDTVQVKKKFKMLNDKLREKSLEFRPTLLDNVNVDTVRVSPGSYELSKPFGKGAKAMSISPEHKRSSSLPKLPGAGDYTPIPVSFSTFSSKRSLSTSKPYSKQNAKQKPKKQATSGPGPKYSLIVDWTIAKDKNGRNIGHNYLNSLYARKTKGVYH